MVVVDEAHEYQGWILPCVDENDDGVPSFCTSNPLCPFNRENPYLAQNKYVLMFGNLGFPYFDKNRGRYQGMAFIWTMLAFIVTLYGCLAVINNTALIRFSYWGWGGSYSTFRPPTDANYTEIFIGLRAYVASSCFYLEDLQEFECFEELRPWNSEDLTQHSWSSQCAAACLSTWVGALTSCFPMIFAMLGASNRMRSRSDAPQQKMLGCITDSIGAVSLAFTLIAFERGCFADMSRNEPFDDPLGFPVIYPDGMHWWRGIGYWIFWFFCFTGGVIRAVIHWLTPLPGMGVGLSFIQPEQGFNKSKLLVGGTKRKIAESAHYVGHRIAQQADKVGLGSPARHVGHGVSKATAASVNFVESGVGHGFNAGVRAGNAGVRAGKKATTYMRDAMGKVKVVPVEFKQDEDGLLVKRGGTGNEEEDKKEQVNLEIEYRVEERKTQILKDARAFYGRDEAEGVGRELDLEANEVNAMGKVKVMPAVYKPNHGALLVRTASVEEEEYRQVKLEMEYESQERRKQILEEGRAFYGRDEGETAAAAGREGDVNFESNEVNENERMIVRVGNEVEVQGLEEHL